jgi:hypothetical protein
MEILKGKWPVRHATISVLSFAAFTAEGFRRITKPTWATKRSTSALGIALASLMIVTHQAKAGIVTYAFEVKNQTNANVFGLNLGIGIENPYGNPVTIIGSDFIAGIPNSRTLGWTAALSLPAGSSKCFYQMDRC